MGYYIYEMKDEEIFYKDGYVEELLMLFYRIMSYKELYDCLNFTRFMIRFYLMGVVGKKLL